MFYSLKNRFKGCLVGAYLGTKLTENLQLQEDIEKILYLSKILIIEGDLEKKNITNTNFDIYDNFNSYQSDKLALLLLPIFLFYHDNFNLLTEKLKLFQSQFQWSEEVLEDLQIWSQAIALIIKQKSKRTNILEQILISQDFNNNQLIKQLKIIKKNIEQVGSLQDLIRSLAEYKKDKTISLALVFYYFASTPEDFSLTIKRAIMTTSNQNKIIIPLTGALSGIYNSYIGISTQWRTETKADKMSTEIESVAEKLFSVWCGVYSMDQNNLSPMTAVAAANVMQPRCFKNHY